ncbi:universal stress protein [Brachybacterium hainanense]|uniref:Universal stress protein n=1 Tax=Brachybacterium hainanense TaxID=1541174 RepID=A0ABV6R684_9MICO
MDYSGKIVVGHDDSAASSLAVRYAARLALAAGKELRIIHAWIWPLLGKNVEPVDGVADSGLRNQALALLRGAAEEARAAAPGVQVGTSLITGHARVVLGEASRTADLVVVGHRGLGGFFGMLLGSVSLGLVTHAGCPVLVVRTEEEPEGPVLVGVDGSQAGAEAVVSGVRIARMRRSPLKIVHVHRVVDGRSAMSAQEAAQVLEEGVAQARVELGEDAGIEVTGELVESRTVPQGLLAAAQEARIVVVGFQGQGRRRFGSTAHAIMHHAPGNAAICRHEHIPVETDEAPQVVEES